MENWVIDVVKAEGGSRRLLSRYPDRFEVEYTPGSNASEYRLRPDYAKVSPSFFFRVLSHQLRRRPSPWMPRRSSSSSRRASC
jgi:hypothetical protein